MDMMKGLVVGKKMPNPTIVGNTNELFPDICYVSIC
jgi:hypothetical protein